MITDLATRVAEAMTTGDGVKLGTTLADTWAEVRRLQAEVEADTARWKVLNDECGRHCAERDRLQAEVRRLQVDFETVERMRQDTAMRLEECARQHHAAEARATQAEARATLLGQHVTTLLRLTRRADFYVGRGKAAEWLGSIAFDGYPDGARAAQLLAAPPSSEQDFRDRVAKLLAGCDDATLPEYGWPWPWEDSRTTDYSYAWEDGVWISSFGHAWSKGPDVWHDGPKADFPDMSSRQRVTMGPRSGLTILGLPK